MDIQNPLNALSAQAAADLMQQLEREVQAALDAYAPGWTLEDVRWRCEMVSTGPGTTETLKFDGTPLLEIYPVELTIKQDDPLKTIIRYTRKARRLYPCAHVGP